MDNIIKEAFQKVKQDIFSLGNEIQQLRAEMLDIKTEIKLISSFISALKTQQLSQESTLKTIPTTLPQTSQNHQFNQPQNPNFQAQSTIQTPQNQQFSIPTHLQEKPTFQHIIPTLNQNPTHIPTHHEILSSTKYHKTQVSTGNEGVPTDRQTDRQTNQHIIQHIKTSQNTPKNTQINHLEKADEILRNLDSLKKEIRLKFKRLTGQEIAVFSLLYSLESQGNNVDYALLATTLKLSESSIRDYILKIQKKGIPIIKEKLNNKKILLHISQELRKIASLDTILALREL